MKLLILVFLALFLVENRATACTSAVVAPQRSSEGVPLLWKHRDYKYNATCVKHFEGGKYSYTAIASNKEKKTLYMPALTTRGLVLLTPQPRIFQPPLSRSTRRALARR